MFESSRQPLRRDLQPMAARKSACAETYPVRRAVSSSWSATAQRSRQIPGGRASRLTPSTHSSIALKRVVCSPWLSSTGREEPTASKAARIGFAFSPRLRISCSRLSRLAHHSSMTSRDVAIATRSRRSGTNRVYGRTNRRLSFAVPGAQATDAALHLLEAAGAARPPLPRSG